ncbi:MAG TPA: BlaI/MecI/CopY family transcriptional regulator [Acidobacteriaceae bacterium]|jgi:predicted transcriptional regulator|nr:BlaI/MecI/CopY family transcriptional regulator [Acidobacteriaceae bacterium]
MMEPKASSNARAQHGRADHPIAGDPSVGILGRREREVLTVLRELGTATVQQVADRLSASLAYTTVMTTLDRLFRKGLLQREKQNRAFLYSATLSARDLEGQRAAHLIRRFFSESDMRPEVLISCLVDAVHHYDTELLDQLESSIQQARAQPDPSPTQPEKSGKEPTR